MRYHVIFGWKIQRDISLYLLWWTISVRCYIIFTLGDIIAMRYLIIFTLGTLSMKYLILLTCRGHFQ